MRVLVVGGTGGFGSIIARHLADDGHKVCAAGRDKNRGSTFTKNNPDIGFAVHDRSRIKPDDLANFDIVVDASGPFQKADLSLPTAAIAAGIDYLDIADDRHFIRNVATLDKQAKQAGVRVIPGVSSIPTLSGAVSLQLAQGMTEVEAVEIAISASSQAAFGNAVLLSMLEGAGQPIRRSDGSSGTAMTDMRPIKIDRAGADLQRSVLEVDSPDHDTLPSLLLGNPSIRFYAGSELAIHNYAMSAIAFLVSHNVVAIGTRFLSLARLARRISGSAGDGRSGMQVRITGMHEGKRVRRTWSVLAERNMGPIIPCLGIPAMVQAISANRVSPGAGPRVDILAPDEILSRMPAGSISIEIMREPASLYARAMSDFKNLDPSVHAMHDQPLPAIAKGRAKVTRGTSLIARLVAGIFGFPAASDDTEVSVHFEKIGEKERWTRDFGGKTFSSILSQRPGGVCETFGPFTFDFQLRERDGELAMVPAGWSLLSIPLPRWLMPSGIAAEVERDGRFTFDVPIILPIVGLVVHYQGWLEPDKRNGNEG